MLGISGIDLIVCVMVNKDSSVMGRVMEENRERVGKDDSTMRNTLPLEYHHWSNAMPFPHPADPLRGR